MPNLQPGLLLKDQLLSSGLQLPAGATTTVSSAIDLGSGPYSVFDPQRLEFVLQTPALLETQIAQSQIITYGVQTSAYTSGASSISYIGALGPNMTAGTSGGSAMNLYFRLPQNIAAVGGRFLFVTATSAASSNVIAASSAVANLYAVV